MRRAPTDMRAMLARIDAALVAKREEAEARANGQDGPVGRFHEALAAALREHNRAAIARQLAVTPRAVYSWATFRVIPRPSDIAYYTDRLQELI